MPELPEVETMRRGIASIVGLRIDRASRPPCKRRPVLIQPRMDAFDRRVRGRLVTAVGRRGKRVMIVLDDDQTIVIEPRMTGLVLLSDPPTEEHLRLRLEFSPSGTLLFWDRRGLGTVRLLRRDEIATVIDAKLGVDALEITDAQLRAKLGASRRAIKVGLLDQSAVAGIGNLYASEILFLAGIDPRTRCDCLTGSQWSRIQTCTTKVLCEAIRYEGSTLSDGTYRNALNKEGGYQNHHRVYDRAGVNCPRCGKDQIRRIVQSQRSTFFCRHCQRKRGLHESVERS